MAAAVGDMIGGIGNASQKTLQPHATAYPLHIVTVSSEGKYVSDVDIQIVDANGKTLLETSATGPKLYAQVEPGTYTVKGTLDGKTKTQKVQINAGETAQATLRWSDHVIDCGG